jgi:hypothetical protein
MHPVNGLAWWHEPLGFIRSTQMNLNVINETRRIVQSVDSAGKAREYYSSGVAPVTRLLYR